MQTLTEALINCPKEDLIDLVKGLPDHTQQVIFEGLKEKNRKYTDENYNGYRL